MNKKPKDVLRQLETLITQTEFSNDTNIYVIIGSPYSDIGKGTIAAHLIRVLPNSNIIKFDGMLNSNLDNRYTARDHDDFTTYTKYNPSLTPMPANHIIAGDLLSTFVQRFGETTEVLTFMPHVRDFFLVTLQQKWSELGKPKNLILEIGGTPEDYESQAYIMPALNKLRSSLHSRLTILLLAPLMHNGDFIKTQVVTRAVESLHHVGIIPNLILAREPQMNRQVGTMEHLDNERQMRQKLIERTGITIRNILSIPFFNDIDELTGYIDHNLKPILLPHKVFDTLLIGTHNKNKLKEWQNELSTQAKITSLADIDLAMDVPEGLVSVAENSLAKARAYCRASGLPVLADDVGFYIHELNGQPGVAIRRWGGLLPETTTDEEFFHHLEQEMATIEDTECHFERCISIVTPSGKEFQLTYETHGRIDKTSLTRERKKSENLIGMIFKPNKNSLVWADLNNEQELEVRQAIIKKLITILQKFSIAIKV